jgi:hypothetical protein
MSITSCVVYLRFIEALSRALDPEGPAVSPSCVSQVAWIHIQMGSFEPDTEMFIEDTAEPEVAGVAGKPIHEAASVELHALSGLVTTFGEMLCAGI